jgi:hypothetical protein
METRDRFEIKRSYSALGRWMLTDKQTGKVTYHRRRAEAIVRRARLVGAAVHARWRTCAWRGP